MNVIITGLGKEVHFLIKSFLSKKYSVTVIEENPSQCKYLSRTHSEVVVVQGNPSNPDVLKDAGIIYADMIIALTQNDYDNLVICQVSKKMFGIKKTFAVVHDPQNIDIFKKLGLDTVISTTNIISNIIERKTSVDEILNLIPVEDGKLSIFELKITDTSPVINKKLMEIKLPVEALIGCIIRDGEAIIPRGNTVILPKDKLVILALPSAEKELFSILRGDK